MEPYLKDIPFLMELTKNRNKEIYAIITSLDFKTETEIGQVEGLIINGNLSVDSSSSVRRTGNLSIFCNMPLYDGDPLSRDINYYKKFFGLSKKIKIKLGLSNSFNPAYPKIIWFPMGVYVITNASFNNSNNGITININIGDKMNLLNGYCGGTITSSIELDKAEDIDSSTGEIIYTRKSIYQMIMELVNHFGGEQVGKILISDLDTKTKTGFKIKADCKDSYYIRPSEDGISATIEKKEDDNLNGETVFSADDFIGYQEVDYTYPTKDYFTLNAGDSVVSGLDKIKSMIGNYEYFYDVDGNFRWQEIKNYKNTSKATVDLKNLKNENYLIDKSNGNALYNFENSPIIISYNNNPQYSNIKNDFIIWGTRTVGEGSNKQTYPIKYHLAIDDKPEIPNTYNENSLYFIIESKDKSGNLIYSAPIYYDKISDLPSIGAENAIYYIKNENNIYKYNISNDGNYIKIFSKDNLINSSQNVKSFYQVYDNLKENAKQDIINREKIFANLEKLYNQAYGILYNYNALLEAESKTIKYSINGIDSFIKQLNKNSNDFSSCTKEIPNIAEKTLEGEFLTENKNNITFTFESSYPYLKYILGINISNFYDNALIVENNFEKFKINILIPYLNNYQKNINKYKNDLDKYLKYCYAYEQTTDAILKENIKKSANSIFNFKEFNLAELFNKIKNFSKNTNEKTIAECEKSLENKNNIFKDIYSTLGLDKNIFILNSSYKIGASKGTTSLIQEYINNLTSLFDDNVLKIFSNELNKQVIILKNIFISYQKKWDQSKLEEEIKNNQNKINKFITITDLTPLSELASTLNSKLEEIKIYLNEADFPKNNNQQNLNVCFLSSDNGSIYINTSKPGYYIANGVASMKYIYPQNWQTLLFLQNFGNFNSENNIYGIELESKWGQLFELIPYKDDLGNNVYKDDKIVYTDIIKESVYKKPTMLNYWLDFIDSKAMDFNNLKISNIGRRTLVKQNNKVNCLFSPIIPDYIIITEKEKIQELKAKGQKYIYMDKDFYNELGETSGILNYSAFDSISNELYNYLDFNNTVNITCLPMFFLNTNTRIKLRDDTSDIYGDYMIKSFSISLNKDASSMNITCTKIIDSI